MAVHWIIEGSLGPSVWWWARSGEGGEETERAKKSSFFLSFYILDFFLILTLCKEIQENRINQPQFHHHEYTLYCHVCSFHVGQWCPNRVWDTSEGLGKKKGDRKEELT